MNILVFNLKLDADDGVLGFTTDWVNALAQRCDQVVVITMQLGAVRVAPNVTVYSVGRERSYGRPRRLVRFYTLLWKVLRRYRFDACFAHMNHLFALLGAPLLKSHAVPILLWYAHKSVTPMLRMTEKLVDGVVTSSASGFQLPSRKLTIVGQGIDTDRFAPAAKLPARGRPLRLLSFGRISRIKRLEIVLEALSHLKETEPQMRFKGAIVGNPVDADGHKYLAELRGQAIALGLGRDVHFAAGVPFHQARNVFRDCDIFLNPGDTDSVDKTCLEAMSSGIPIITSNIAFKDILPADMHATCIVPKEQPRAFAAAVAKIAGWPVAERRAFGLRGRTIVVEEHSIDSLADKLIAAMQALTRTRRRRGNENRRMGSALRRSGH